MCEIYFKWFIIKIRYIQESQRIKYQNATSKGQKQFQDRLF